MMAQHEKRKVEKKRKAEKRLGVIRKEMGRQNY